MLKQNIGQDLCVLRLGLPLVFGLALLVGLLLTMGTARPSEMALAQGPTIRYVAPSPAGNDGGNDCSDSSVPCATVQRAVDVASPGDEIRVATGIYTDVHARPRNDIVATGVVTQVVYISKTATLRGGYTTADWMTSDPEAHPTTLDAQGRGRVFYIIGDISPTIEGLRITGGDAAGLGGSPTPSAGGGVYVITATVAMSNSQVLSNTATVGGGLYFRNSDGTQLADNLISSNSPFGYGSGSGGGAVFDNSPHTMLSNNVVHGNRARLGGGLIFRDSPTATLTANTISNNVANCAGGGMKSCAGVRFFRSDSATLISNTISGNHTANDCGGVCFSTSHNAVLIGNDVISNTRGAWWDGRGVGVNLSNSRNASLIGNTIRNNTASHLANPGTIWGGGVYVGYNSTAALISNTISSNGATRGGGLYVHSNSIVTLTSDIITGNIVYDDFGDWYHIRAGGGLCVDNSIATLTDVVIAGNRTETIGGGLCVDNSVVTLTNAVIADNQVITAGSGVYVQDSSLRLRHATIARNGGGDGSGVYITGTGRTVALTNTILVSHTVGITVAAGNTATLEATLWGTDTWANLADWGGSGTILTGTINLWGDPAFLDPDAGDYHITSASAAIDKGVDAGVTTDIDGDSRPAWYGYDLGADEFALCYVYLPVIVKDSGP